MERIVKRGSIPSYEIPVFINRLKEIAEILSIRPEWLLYTMWIESKLNPYVVNKHSGAIGLIQFLPSTLKSMGLTREDILKMSATKQLDIVMKYLMPYRGKMKNYYDVYLAVFYPKAIGKPDNYIIGDTEKLQEKIALLNKIYDLNENKKISILEIKKVIDDILHKQQIIL